MEQRSKLNLKFTLGFLSLIFLVLESCTNFIPLGDTNIKIQTLDLFSQLPSSEFKDTTVNIYSNWTLRRERLSLIDQELARAKPNIIFFQHLMKKNDTDSDEMILSSNSLARYNFSNFETSSSVWKEYISTVTSTKFVPKESKLHPLETGSFISSQIISYKNDPILLINVQIKSTPQAKLISSIKSIYDEFITNRQVCKHRVIIAGYFGSDLGKNFSDQMEDFYLKNPFSYLKKESISTFKDNVLYKLVIKTPKEPTYNYDYLFVPKSSQVSSPHLIFDKNYPNKFKRSKLKEISPSIRSGLELSLQLKSCH